MKGGPNESWGAWTGAEGAQMSSRLYAHIFLFLLHFFIPEIYIIISHERNLWLPLVPWVLQDTTGLTCRVQVVVGYGATGVLWHKVTCGVTYLTHHQEVSSVVISATRFGSPFWPIFMPLGGKWCGYLNQKAWLTILASLYAIRV